ncbi:MAG: hypothetical protein V1754_15420, partial [Pseudomonadota bacterium]
MQNRFLLIGILCGVLCVGCTTSETAKDGTPDKDGPTDSRLKEETALVDTTEPDTLMDFLGDVLGEEAGLGEDKDNDGWTVGQGDCDDTNDNIFPGSTNHIEGVDYDCDLKREFAATIDVIVDDAYPRLCVNDIDIGQDPASVLDDRIETWHAVMESGNNVVGINGKDIYGVTVAMAMRIRVNGRLIRTVGISDGDIDTENWRYFPKAVDAPRKGWCSTMFDDKTPSPPYGAWGPAILAREEGDNGT